MCHQSVGLVQNLLEAEGIACASVTLKPEITYGVKVSRAAWVRFPLGRPLGPAHRPDLQHRIVENLLDLVADFPRPVEDPSRCGVIVQFPYRWRRS